jgi:hypothetical protein
MGGIIPDCNYFHKILEFLNLKLKLPNFPLGTLPRQASAVSFL